MIYNLNKSNKLQLLALHYLSIFVIAPPLSYGEIYRVIAVIALLSWFLIEAFRTQGIVRKPTWLVLLSFFLIIYISIIEVMTSGVGNLISKLQLFIFILFACIHESYRRNRFHELNSIFMVLLVTMPIWLISTYLGLLENDRAARIIIRSGEEAKNLTSQGIGGFSLVYSSLFYLTVMWGYLKLNEKIEFKLKSIIWINIFLCIVVIIKAQYATALILLCLVISLLIVFNNTSVKNNLAKILFLFSILIYLYFNLMPILNYLSQVFEGTNYYLKILDIQYSLQGAKVGTVDDRVERYLRSLNLFYENIIFGTLDRTSLGKHSQIIDTFAQYGILIGIISCYVFFYIPFYYFKLNRGNSILSFSALIIIFFLCTLNNVAMSFGLFFYLVYPFLISRVYNAK